MGFEISYLWSKDLLVEVGSESCVSSHLVLA